MPTPTLVNVGTAVGNLAAITPGMPAGVLPGDILLLYLETANQAITVSGGTETWAEVADSPQSQGTAGGSDGLRLTTFWARASQSDPTSPTTSDSGDHNFGVIIAFRGCIDTGTPWSVTTGGTQGTSDQPPLTGDTTTVDNCLIVLANAWGADNAGPMYTSMTNADLANIAERFDAGHIEGNGGGIAIYTGEKFTAGTYGTTTSVTVQSFWCWLVIALLPAVEVGEAGSFPARRSMVA